MENSETTTSPLQHDRPTVTENYDDIEPRMKWKFLNDSVFQSPASVAVGESYTPLQEYSFSCFPRLPLELRSRIWSLALPHQRLLRISISGGSQSPGSTVASSPPPHEGSQHPAELGLYEARNALGKVVSSSNYILRLLSSGTSSPLIGVNREAKEAVYNRYRVHVPSVGRQVYDGRGTPCVRFCPEDDTICISLEPTVDLDNNAARFADFVHDTLAYDPRNVGVFHMAIACNGLPSDIILPLDSQSLHSRAHCAFVQILSRLRSVSLLHLVGGDARKMYSSLQFARTAPNPIESVRSCPEEVRFNRAFPIWSSTASFSVLRQDPRPITQYLDIVCLNWDPRAIIRAWRMLEAAYSIPPIAPKKMRVLVAAASDMDGYEFASREEALRARVYEEALWKNRWVEGGPFYKRFFPCPDTKESLEYARAHNAVGFWSFPLEVFGEVPEVDYTIHPWVQPLVLDLRRYESQIELGLFELPK